MGHVVSAEGVQRDPKKLEAVRKFPLPTDVKTLRSFLGLAYCYRRFVPKFATVASSLHVLTKKDAPFVWTQRASVNIKRLLTSAAVLAFPQFDQLFILETYSSGIGLGAVLAQKQDNGSVRPIAYASRTLQPHKKKYGATEMEGLGAIKHFHPYLYGHSCEVFTDHSALTSLLQHTAAFMEAGTVGNGHTGVGHQDSPFDRMGVDIIQFPRSRRQGNQYAVVFDYFTKWPEAFPVPAQSVATVVQLLVEEIIARHGVPAEILLDQGRTFLSGLMKELVGFHKVNTSAYHPQTNGPVECFNRTLWPRELGG